MKVNEKVFKKLHDPKFYLENFVKIKGKKPGALLPFVLNEAQKDLFNTVRQHARVIILKARQIGFCLDKNTKVLSNKLEWIRIGDVKVGDRLIAVKENIPGGSGSGRKMCTTIVEKKCIVFNKAIRIKFDDDREIVATPEHRFLSRVRGAVHTCWRCVSEMKIGDEIRYITTPWDNGSAEDYWFGGILDGEGSLRFNNHTGAEVCAVQKIGMLFEEMKKYALSTGLTFKLEHDNRPAIEGGKFGKNPCAKVVFSRMDELFKIIGRTRPKRFIEKEWWNEKSLPNNGWAKIVSIELLDNREMIDLQTSEHTYIAEGFVSHNSTAMVGYFYHDTIMKPGTNTAIIGYNSSLTSELLDKVKTFYRTTPSELRPTIFYNSKYEISFPRIDSKIMVLPSTENVGRGYTLHNVLATELSAWDKAEEKMMTLEASVPIGGKIVIESTPRGMGNLYHRMWMSDNDYAKNMYGWWWGYSEEEIEVIRRRMNNPQKFAQEYGCRFLSSGRPVFDYDYIEKQYKNVLKVGDIVGDHIVKEEEGLRIYRKPEPDGLYVFGVDVSEGVQGGDYSSVTVWDRKTGEEVAMYRGLIAPDILGEKLDRWGRKYNNALMVVEINNHGLTTVTILRQKAYPTLYFRQMRLETMGVTPSDKLGWRTTKITRPLLIDDFAQAVRDNILTIHSRELLDEMSVFVYDDKGDAVPQEGFHDDTIFSAGIGFQGFKVMYSGELTQIDYKEHLPKNFAY
jgi:hypothetical protein